MTTFLPSVLAEARRKAGWSQQRLADVVGVSKQTIQNAEYGVHVPRSDIAAAMAIALDVPMEAFFAHDLEVFTPSTGRGKPADGVTTAQKHPAGTHLGE